MDKFNEDNLLDILLIFKKLSISINRDQTIPKLETIFEIVRYNFEKELISDYLNKDQLKSFNQIINKYINNIPLTFTKVSSSRHIIYFATSKDKKYIFNFKYIFSKAFGSNTYELEIESLKKSKLSDLNGGRESFILPSVFTNKQLYENTTDTINTIYTKLGYLEKKLDHECPMTEIIDYDKILIFIEILRDYKNNLEKKIFSDNFVSKIDELIEKFDSNTLNNDYINMINSTFRSDIKILEDVSKHINDLNTDFLNLRKIIEDHKTDDFYILDIDIIDINTNEVICSKSYEYDDEKLCIEYSNIIYSIYINFVKNL
jgi:hypothetical protein